MVSYLVVPTCDPRHESMRIGFMRVKLSTSGHLEAWVFPSSRFTQDHGIPWADFVARCLRASFN